MQSYIAIRKIQPNSISFVMVNKSMNKKLKKRVKKRSRMKEAHRNDGMRELGPRLSHF
jgi:hypothetical protein